MLKKLINQRINDADILILNNCYENGIYIAGYALEITLKLKICNLLQFEQGFPESKSEFNIYQNSVKNQALLAGAVTQLKDIRHHDLSKLLFFSGVEYYVKLHFLAEWNLAAVWNPEMRYKILKTSEDDALNKINAIKVIIQNIL
ncbi:MAG: hypothetical protein EOP42_14450 [Sphingobacteriaceae bacterium]|nr:MAG: hypothetical protein EOP42_14450 [Sphingobacteriaceae bacterium]